MKNVLSVAILTVAIACLALTHAAAVSVSADNSPANVDDCSVHPGWATPIGGYWNELYVDSFASSLVKFNNLPDVPAAWVTSATLTLYASAGGAGGDFELHAAQSSWDEASLTQAIWDSWHVHTDVIAFSVAAGNFVDIDVTATVTAWMSGSSPNNGWALESAGGAIYFASTDYASGPTLWPQLKIEFTAPAEYVVAAPNGPADVDDCSVHPGWATPIGGYWNELYVDTFASSLLRFNNLPSIPPADVLAATLTLYAWWGSANVELHAAQSSWDEASLTQAIWDSWHVHTDVIAFSAAAGNFVDIDVTATVTAWMSGSSPNNGWALESAGGDMYFASSDYALGPALWPQLTIVTLPPPAGTVVLVR